MFSSLSSKSSKASVASAGATNGAKATPAAPKVARPAASRNVSTSTTPRLTTPNFSLFRSRDQDAQQSAHTVRFLIAGPAAKGRPTPVKGAIPHAQFNKVKADLTQEKSANLIIAKLRMLPPSGDMGDSSAAAGKNQNGSGPIRAVALPYTDEEADRRHFSNLGSAAPKPDQSAASASVTTMKTSAPNTQKASSKSEVTSVVTQAVGEVSELLSHINIVSLVTTPALGLGQSVEGPGLLSGALPTAETILKGIEELTPEIMSLAYATGHEIRPDDSHIYPPTDRMSCLTYWWGLEIVMPHKSVAYLGSVVSISHTAMNFLTAFAMLNNGVAEIAPVIRYIAQYLEEEFDHIKAQDRGKGVVCAATWLVPVAIVPRSWDFPDHPPPPPPTSAPGPNGTPTSAPAPHDTPTSAPAPNGPPAPNDAPAHATPTPAPAPADSAPAPAPAPAVESAPITAESPSKVALT